MSEIERRLIRSYYDRQYEDWYNGGGNKNKSIPPGIAKKGGWLRVTSGRTTGWIRLLSVRVGAGGLSGSGLRDVVGAATTRSDPTRVVAVAGLRGLNEEDLRKATFNADELARLDKWSVTATQSKSFASQAGLVAIKVPVLVKPRAEQTPSSWESN